MAVQIKQKESSVVDTVLAEDAEVSARVDIYGSAVEELQKRMAELEPLTNMVEKLKKGLVAEGADCKADAKVVLAGTAYDITLSAKGKSVTDIDKKALRKALGKATYFELASIGVGDIRKYCTPPQIETILTEERGGARTVKIARK